VKQVRAKVGTIPMTIDIARKRKIKVGDKVKWKRHAIHGAKWEGGIITLIIGPDTHPEVVFLTRN